MIEISCFIDVFEDDYKNGELEHANSFSMDTKQFHHEHIDIKGAVEDYFESILYYSFEWDKSYNLVFHHHCLQYTVLVNNDNCEASEREINEWKKGRLKLYSSSLHITVKEFKEVDVNLERINDGSF